MPRSPGSFYLRSRAVLHFHEDPAGLFADVRTGADWERFPVNTRREQNVLRRLLHTGLASVPEPKASNPARKRRI
jgi:hypothetical protein